MVGITNVDIPHAAAVLLAGVALLLTVELTNLTNLDILHAFAPLFPREGLVVVGATCSLLVLVLTNLETARDAAPLPLLLLVILLLIMLLLALLILIVADDFPAA